jgi:hypothetical protein
MRASLTVLVASDTRVPVPPHRENGAEPITDTPATPWASLRPRLHAIVSAADSAERHVIANDLQITSSTLRNICSTTVLGAAVIGRVDGWRREMATGRLSERMSQMHETPPMFITSPMQIANG